jgi:diguanylate cyclase (GGDEF)-like protein
MSIKLLCHSIHPEKPWIDSLTMTENMISERAWRRDPAEAVTVLGASERNEATELRSTTFPGIRQWSQTAQSWARALLGRFPAVPVGFEQVLHSFVVVLETADDRAAVEAALLQAVRRLAPATQIELSSESGQTNVAGPGGGEQTGPSWRRRSGQSMLEIPLQCGDVVHGYLRICSKSGDRSSVTKGTSRRLSTLCTLAASALENFQRPSERHSENDDAAQADPACDGSHLSKEFNSTPMLRDATFLSVVLPFVLAQAQRHRESLSLLWVEIDRLAGIRELLGGAEADHLVRHVGEAVAALLRSSDIVARLDDNRIVVILPRATSDDALLVAQKIGRDIAEKNHEAAAIPRVTISIGAATFPTCAYSVSSLFSAADEALAQARSHGRGRVVMAPPRPIPQPTRHTQARIPNPVEKATTG